MINRFLYINNQAGSFIWHHFLLPDG